MRRLFLFMLTGAILMGMPMPASSKEKADLSLEAIIKRIEARYATTGFSARFLQESTIKALEITDMATGKMVIKRPGKMRWEYEQPEKQMIITDGRMLWAYRPDDNQVMMGKSPLFFADGKGAGFLSDINLIRAKFKINLEPSDNKDVYKLKLVPAEPVPDLSTTYLLISADNFYIVEIITYNAYEDETRIKLQDIEFQAVIDDALFTFQVPENAEIIKLDE
jgi:outer membrane lipoprotein carrier protein